VRLEDEHYRAFGRFLEQSCGIVLGDTKQYLVASRLGPLLAQHGFRSLGELVDRLASPTGGALRGQVIEAMTTNETQFFRDAYPFEILRRDLFPEFQQRRLSQVRAWSAGCSSGQEAYSAIMTAQEYADERGRLELDVVGTDISQSMIRQATAGRYSQGAISRGLDERRLSRFFVQLDAATWELRPEIRRRASFRQHNLLESFAPLGRFDVIFCRNVLIYFSQESRHDILTRMARTLNPGGYLILGGSESLSRQISDFELVRASAGVIYRVRAKT
jgi:chemotaxis protein methyltransferase CheR